MGKLETGGGRDTSEGDQANQTVPDQRQEDSNRIQTSKTLRTLRATWQPAGKQVHKVFKRGLNGTRTPVSRLMKLQLVPHSLPPEADFEGLKRGAIISQQSMLPPSWSLETLKTPGNAPEI